MIKTGAAAAEGSLESGVTDFDVHLFAEGTHYRSYRDLGAHLVRDGKKKGVRFAVWAPNAKRVSVVGDFNGWDRSADILEPTGSSGIWQGFTTNAGEGSLYKLVIQDRRGSWREKADPYAFAAELRPQTASKVWNLDSYNWADERWMAERAERNSLQSPISVYEVHLGSWMRVPEEGERWLTYREAAPKLAEYVTRLGFTHVEFLPLTEHPLDASWGYQTLGLFSPTSRFGTPDDFKYLVDYLHQQGIGVLLDWVPAHFPFDSHGLAEFDGTALFEHADPRQGHHQDWGTAVYNYGRNEVRSFLLSSALFWFDEYHIDGLRVDAVASMLYLDYSREDGEWIPNKYGGRENLDAVSFLRSMNEIIYREYPDTITVAEESTSWPMVSRPVYLGGLGFGFKWDMGWMHDSLSFISLDPVHRKYHQDLLTFRMLYAFSENFMLPLSHDEVVHGKGSLLNKMPGDTWQKFANLRLYFSFMYGQNGKKLLFMGGEFGQWREWDCHASLDWILLENPLHRGVQALVGDLNHLYRRETALHQLDCSPEGFRWVDCSDTQNNVVCWLRQGGSPDDLLLFVCNFTPVPRMNYRVGVPCGGFWYELFNSDSELYGGSNLGNNSGVTADDSSAHGHDHSLALTLPPLAALVFKPSR